MKYILTVLVFLSVFSVKAQKTTYDIFSFESPRGWSKDEKSMVISYVKTDQAKGSWCRISVYKSTISKGTLDADFNSEWQELVVKTYNGVTAPQLTDVQEENGWKAKAGVGKFTFNKQDAVAMLTTMSNKTRCGSIVAATNDQSYMADIEKFLGTVDLVKTTGTTPIKTSDQPKQLPIANLTGFSFNTTNFDDGWVGVVKEDWVEVTKGSMKVLLHYPRSNTIIAADPEPHINNAWNILVAPRYSDIRNYRTVSSSLDYIRPYLGYAQLKDNASGKQVFVALFRKGDTGWLEFVCPDKNSFINTFHINPDQLDWQTSSETWNPLVNMTTYNRFAVEANDLKGTWTSDFTGMTEYYNSYTGAHTATTMHQSSETFVFLPGNSYNWKLMAINGQIGAARYDEAKNSGKFSMNGNWQVNFSNIEGKAKTFNVYFSCIKGARLLWMQDAKYPTSWTCFGLGKQRL